jgi:2-polyprenyl-3-methyl-5-hydroxy-6-metoxy-1,4-benzoquinol methylase
MLTNDLGRYVVKRVDPRKTLTGGEWEYYDVGGYVVKSIDLGKTLLGGDGGYDASSWAELTGDMRRASTLLRDSPHVKLLEQYRVLGEELFDGRNFERTAYFQNAAQCVRYCGDYFGHRTREGLVAQARSFVNLYERMANADPTEVRFLPEDKHSDPGSLPAVRETLTANTFQVVGGNHRLASAWVCGRREIEAAVLQPPAPTALQSLVLAGAQTATRRELCQPIDSEEFDATWGLVRRCDDRLAMMLRHLASTGHDISGLSVVDLACSYGWFVSEFSKRRAVAIGVDRAPWALKIGRIAYGLRPEQLVHSDLMTFLSECDRTYDVVLLLSALHHFALRPDFGSPEEVLKKVDAVTGSHLFLDTGQAHEQWWRNALPEWNTEFIIELVKRHTSFSKVLPLGVDSDNRDPYGDNYARTLFACVRS